MRNYLQLSITKDAVPKITRHVLSLKNISKDSGTDCCLADVHKAITELDDLISTTSTCRLALKHLEAKLLTRKLK